MFEFVLVMVVILFLNDFMWVFFWFVGGFCCLGW